VEKQFILAEPAWDGEPQHAVAMRQLINVGQSLLTILRELQIDPNAIEQSLEF
jgi:hypothetical protein